MKDSFLNKIQTVWISSYVVWTNKHTHYISKVNQSCVVWLSEWVCYHISKWHTDILQNKKRAWKTCQESSQKISRKNFLS